MFTLARKDFTSLNFIHGRGQLQKKTWHVIKQINGQYSTFSKYLHMTVEVYINKCIMYALCDYECIHLILG